MNETKMRLIRDELSPLISEKFNALGFRTEDGIRYFRRNNNLVHYIIFSLKELTKELHGTKTNGNHLTYSFGEFLTHAPDLVVKPETLNVSVCCGATNPIAFVNRKHFKGASERIIEALTNIDADRFSQVRNEEDYEKFHLTGSPSLEKVYHLTTEERHEEADAWLKLITHEYREFRCVESYSGEKALRLYVEEPSDSEVSFYDLSIKERVNFVDELRSLNIRNNALEFLYEEL